MRRKGSKTAAAAAILAAAMTIPAFAGQWQSNATGWWYVNDSGQYSANTWQWINGKCYYFDQNGYMLANTITPDGYLVNADGAWTLNGVIQTRGNQGSQATGASQSGQAASKAILDQYGYNADGSSVLSFKLGTSMTDKGSYYEIPADYYQAITVPGNLKVGDTVTVTWNGITGETKKLVRRGNSLYEYGSGKYAQEYYYSYSGNSAPIELYQDSDDRVEKLIYHGTLSVRKDATYEVPIMRSVESFAARRAGGENYEEYVNGVFFDANGYVTRLVCYGD